MMHEPPPNSPTQCIQVDVKEKTQREIRTLCAGVCLRHTERGGGGWGAGVGSRGRGEKALHCKYPDVQTNHAVPGVMLHT